MKILAIRGRNLASLQGDFAVELTEGALGRAGLFAITGDTGTGKSTLLDALCLALFDKTPRLQGRGHYRIGLAGSDEQDRIGANDVRGLLTRGTGEGWAEVDFTGLGGGRHRARWSVRRARNRPDRRLQAQEMWLRDLDTNVKVGGKKTEVLQAIQVRLGLTFDQFCRSALLAQGDFAAFFEASEGDRAKLLERVTGTERYGAISKAAFEEAGRQETALETLVAQREVLGRLSPEVRVALDAQVTEARADHARARVQVKVAEEAGRWFATQRTLRVAVAEGQRLEAEHVVACAVAKPRQALLVRVQRVQPLRALVGAESQAAAVRDVRTKALAVAVAARTAADRALGIQGAHATAAHATKVAAGARREVAQPDLERAVELDVQVRAADSSVAAAAVVAEVAGAAQTRAAAAAAAARGAEVKTRTTLDGVAAWLSAHPFAEALVGGWLHTQPELERLSLAAGAWPAAAEAVAGGRVRVETAEVAVVASRAAHEVTTTALAEVAARLTAAEAMVPEGARSALDARRGALMTQAEVARGGQTVAEDARTFERARLQAVQRAAEDTAEAEGQRQVAAAAEAEAQTVAEALKGLEVELRRAQAMRSQDAHRGELVSGAPCPLCGSTAHPWAVETPEHPLDPLEAERALLQTKRRSLAAASAEAKTKVTHLRRRAVEARDQAAELEARLPEKRAAWAQARAALGSALATELPAEVLDEMALPLVSARYEALTTALDGLATEVAALSTQEGAITNARRAVTSARDAHDEATDALGRAQTALEAAAVAQRAHTQGLDALGRQRETALEALARGLGSRPGWRTQLDEGVGICQARLTAEVEDFRRHDARRQDAQAILEQQVVVVIRAEADLTQARQVVIGHETERAKVAARAQALKVARAAVLDGRSVDTVKAALKAEVEGAEQVYAVAQASLQAVEGQRVGAGVAADQATTELKGAQVEAEAAQVALAGALTEGGWVLAEVLGLLVHDDAWIRVEVLALEALERGRTQAVAVLKERQMKQAEHTKTRAPEGDWAHAQAALEAAQEAEAEAAVTRQTLDARALADDKAVAKTVVLGTKIAAQEVVSQRWAVLKEVIGSASGNKFRTFAQGLTLELLLSHANAHLKAFAPRYALQRVPGADLDLQVVDAYLGDDVRAVNSLSGGEIFLASLALALGLSSLSASNTPVETVFIDEGFGALDRSTLDRALEALDALQATGRQVGVISHVEGLREHIAVKVEVVRVSEGRSRVLSP